MKHASILMLACGLLLAGCGDSDVQEVRQWMKEVDATTRVAVKPLAEPKTFVPFVYASQQQPDPFNPNKLITEARARAGDGAQPDMGRRKEFLEGFPLDTMKMVGTLQKGSAVYGLLQIDRTVYQVRAGQHLGQNFGLITAVTMDAVHVKELVQDAAGEWVERMSKLELQGSKESTQ
ncbi:pilus assembly protein PilP [Pseudoduganella plicata]|uniref:Pilus assembly protein PilP n=1 Tax=Pseudoduganella plicata TaxID=321984 RepID=A0A4P7BI17_9BURK|nr:pilus assembly protein PilP [Pseudoduganella plicata]QBQ37990.1 pilus assembly protein PilP [Pseudoduganella plicata]GGZ03893.1 type 4 fimbrial biogenesis protein PilP [Pseudoduganella plicata]